MEQKLDTILHQLEILINEVKQLKQHQNIIVNTSPEEVNEIKIDVKSDVKECQSNLKSKRGKGKHTVGYFSKKRGITWDMCEFLKEKRGTKKSLAEITSFLMNYIKQHNLLKDETVIMDGMLQKIFNEIDEPITIYNIQKGVQRHFK